MNDNGKVLERSPFQGSSGNQFWITTKMTIQKTVLLALMLLPYLFVGVLSASQKEQPNSSDAETMAGEQLYRKGLSYLQRKEYVEAVETFSKAIDLGSHETGLYVGRAEALYKLHQYEEALRDISKALNDKPYHVYGYMVRAAIYSDGLGKAQEAVSDLTTAIRINPGNPAAYYMRGALFLRMGQLDAALQDVSKAILLGGPDGLVEKRALILEKLGRYSEAIEDLTFLLNNKPQDAEILSQRGWCYLCLGDMDNALADFDLVLEKRPDDLNAYIQRGWVYLEKERYQAAFDNFSKALDINPNSSLAHMYLAALHFAKGEYEAAYTQNTKALNDSLEGTLQIDVMFQQGLILLAMNKPTEGEQAYRKAAMLAQQLGDVEALEYGLQDLNDLPGDLEPSTRNTLTSLNSALRELKGESVHRVHPSSPAYRVCRRSFI